jgi:hypothetical protein
MDTEGIKPGGGSFPLFNLPHNCSLNSRVKRRRVRAKGLPPFTGKRSLTPWLSQGMQSTLYTVISGPPLFQGTAPTE